eukprot:TRINITY_DN4469_c0_g1_i1.p1 TRINITY_DN4469_c0_g1~~TRINITY_DN4469_c0_g1_i1.p1  ORF type:complete len:113 (-),score=2.97 TRINITY_DN4469_c0_g1_i1:21-359(-)
MNFCRECNNMLYPKEDKVRKVLLFSCHNCGHSEAAENSRTYKNEILHAEEEKTVIFQDIASDPTLPRTSSTCAKCGNKEAVYFQATSATSREEAMTLYFVCTNPTCGHRWKE